MAVDISVEGDFNCHECNDGLKVERGCDSPGIVSFECDGEWFNRCPVKIVSDVSKEYLRAYRFYDKAILPNGVGWNNESFKFCQAMGIIENEVKKIEAKKSVK